MKISNSDRKYLSREGFLSLILFFLWQPLYFVGLHWKILS